MSFFDKKQEVMDVKLTQFGKKLLSIGRFKPVFYQFFDDDILYDLGSVGGSEHQNKTEDRVLKNTPKLKTLHITYPVSERYSFEEREIQAGNMSRFEEMKEAVFPHIQERILLYPLSNQDIANNEVPRFDISNVGAPIKKVTFSALTAAGIQKKEPILEINPKYTIKEDRQNLHPPGKERKINDETFIDITAKEVVFSDNSKLTVTPEKVILDIQELNCFTGLENFHLNIYEIIESEETDNLLIKLDTIEKVNKYFSIKTDKDVSEIEVKDPEANNYYKRGEG